MERSKSATFFVGRPTASSPTSTANSSDPSPEEETATEASPPPSSALLPAAASTSTSTSTSTTGSRRKTTAAGLMRSANARLSASAAAAATRLSQLVGENPPMGSTARVVRRQYQSIAKEREKEYEEDDEDLDAIVLYEVEFPKPPTMDGEEETNLPLGIGLETDFYGKHALVMEVKRGSLAYPLAKKWIKPGHIVVGVNGRDLSKLSFQDVLRELRTAKGPRVIRFLDPNVLPIEQFKHEPLLVNRDQYGFAKDDKYILNYRKQLRKRKLANYEHEREWTAFVQQQGGMDVIDRLLHDTKSDHETLRRRSATLAELRTLVLKGIPIVLRPRVWSVLAHVTPYKSRYPPDYYHYLVAKSDTTPAIADIEKDLSRTYPEHMFFQSDKGKQELKNVLCAYALHNPRVGYCQSMNFIAGMMVLFMDEEEAFWLLCAMLEPRYLPAENYTQSMVGTQTDQLVFQQLVTQELPALATRLELCGVQIALVTLHWFLCAFVCTLPTESALRVWDWFFLDGQEVLFTTAIGVLKLSEPRLLRATTHSDLHTIVRELGTDLHDEDELMAFLYEIATPEKEDEKPGFSKVEELSMTSEEGDGELHDDDDDEVVTRSTRKSLTARAGGGLAHVQKLLQLLEARRKQQSPGFRKKFTMSDIERLRAECRPQVLASSTRRSIFETPEEEQPEQSAATVAVA
ncbi:hypothetical protein Poli38472_013971 [Pythium oligandrum]|uniref:Rab-GAP TBC domain-containing protein n=1 Tax=Pythium oligandrum TaxID=41045 RepID=A0A8K1FMV1_PYTOL|nr:hypothetical protein Poli38472_013971 [Pythium oligandrum]|eukprot:TMW66659.1 hypothetical protein Poli38472_013971 [Pythium oligandrum]